MSNLIYLLSDFGLNDYYVAAMKSVILSINPRVKIIDISHNVGKWNILEGAFLLWQIITYTPRESILVGVVDPGVGTERKEIIIETKSNRFLVGPDNGLLYPAAVKDGISNVWIINRNYFKKISSTFHGRDVFAPVAAYISKGLFPGNYCKRGNISDINKLDLFEYELSQGKIVGKILHVDVFGNIITNIPCKTFKKLFVVGDTLSCNIGDLSKSVRFVNTFYDLDKDELGVICGGSELIEIVANKNYAIHFFPKISIGQKIIISKNHQN